MKHFSLPKDGGLIEKGLPKDILHSKERIFTEILDTPYEASQMVADEVIKAIKAFKPTAAKPLFKLGLTTGNSPLPLYNDLKRACANGEVSFANVEVFSVDEYYPVAPDAAQSRNNRLRVELLDHIDIKEENIHIPDGSIPEDKISDYCAKFDKAARGLDLLVIGVGEKGQVAFNESWTDRNSRTRVVLLPYQSRKRQASNFNGDILHTPSQAITMGIATMMSASKVILMAWGEDKAAMVQKIVEKKIDPDYPASFFQMHENVKLYVDENSGANLMRMVAQIGRAHV